MLKAKKEFILDSKRTLADLQKIILEMAKQLEDLQEMATQLENLQSKIETLTSMWEKKV